MRNKNVECVHNEILFSHLKKLKSRTLLVNVKKKNIYSGENPEPERMDALVP